MPGHAIKIQVESHKKSLITKHKALLVWTLQRAASAYLRFNELRLRSGSGWSYIKPSSHGAGKDKRLEMSCFMKSKMRTQEVMSGIIAQGQNQNWGIGWRMKRERKNSQERMGVFT